MIDNAELHKILRYVSGESQPEEASAIRAWLERDPEFRAQVEAWLAVRDARPPAWDTEQALATVQRELHQGERRPAVRLVAFPAREVPVKQRVIGYAFRVAAALLVGAGVAMVWRMERALRAPHVQDNTAVSIALQEYAARRGQRAAFRLTDGTRVMLAADTRLRVPRDFGRRGARREIQLDGAAYFEVTHDETRPFVVHTATGTTEDLGTTFTVRAYPAETATEVVVAEGRVAVQPTHRSALGDSKRQVLTAAQLARFDAGGDLRIERGVDLVQYLAWTKGILTFDHLPFNRAAADIERWYDLDIRLADPALGGRRISGMFGSESVDAVLGYLALALDARYARAGRRVTFYPRAGMQ